MKTIHVTISLLATLLFSSLTLAQPTQYMPIKATYILDPADADGVLPDAAINVRGDVIITCGEGSPGYTERVRIYRNFAEDGLAHEGVWNCVEPDIDNGWLAEPVMSANAAIVVRYGKNGGYNANYNNGSNYSGNVVIYSRGGDGGYTKMGILPDLCTGDYNIIHADISPNSRFIAIIWEAPGSSILHIYRKNGNGDELTESGYHLIQDGFRSGGDKLVAITFDNEDDNVLGIVETHTEDPNGESGEGDTTTLNMFIFWNNLGTFQQADSHVENKAYLIHPFRISAGMITIEISTSISNDDYSLALFTFDKSTSAITKMLPPFLNPNDIRLVNGDQIYRPGSSEIMFGELLLLRVFSEFYESEYVILYNSGFSMTGDWRLENFLQLKLDNYSTISTSAAHWHILRRSRLNDVDTLTYYLLDLIND